MEAGCSNVHVGDIETLDSHHRTEVLRKSYRVNAHW